MNNRISLKAFSLVASSMLTLSLLPSAAMADTITPTPTAVEPVYVNSNEIEVAMPLLSMGTSYNFTVQLNGQPIDSFVSDGPEEINGELYCGISLEPPFGPATLSTSDQLSVVATATGETSSQPLLLSVSPLTDAQTAQPSPLTVQCDGTTLEVSGSAAEGLTKITIWRQGEVETMGNALYDNGLGQHTFDFMMNDPRIQAGDQLTLIASAPGEQDAQPLTITVPQPQPFPQP